MKRIMLKRFITILISTILIFTIVFPASCSAELFHWGTDKGFRYSSHVKKYVYLIKYFGKKRNVTIPKKVDGLKVKWIEKYGKIEKLHIPAGVEVKYLPNAKKLKKITVSKKHKKYSVKNNMLLNKKGTTLIFSLKNNLTVNLPSTVKKIGANAFTNAKFTEFTLPEQIKSVDNGAFYNCKNLRSISFHDRIEILPNNVFGSCTQLESFTIHNSVKSIGSSAFAGCKSLKEINIPDSVTEIGSGAFSTCELLQEITIPPNVKNLDGGIFWNCSNLKTLTLNDNLETLDGDFMIEGCTKLEELHIPQSVNYIGYNTLRSKDLKRVYIYNKKCKIRFAIDNKYVYIEEPAFHPDTVIYGYRGSTAERFAGYNGNQFVALD